MQTICWLIGALNETDQGLFLTFSEFYNIFEKIFVFSTWKYKKN